MKPLPILLATGSLALFAVGCGGDDTKSDSATTGDTASEARGYAETGQAISDICTRIEAEAKPLATQLNGEADHDAPIVEKLVNATDKYVEELKSIEPDPKLQDTFDQYVTAVEDSQAKLREVIDVAKSGDSEAYRMAAEAANGENKTAPLERALGATECTKN
jgi:hypothetical protein